MCAAVRKAVTEWRESGYIHVTATTQMLLNVWFRNDHRLPDGRRAAYHLWQFLKVQQVEFEKLQPWEYADLMALPGAA